MFNFLKNIIIFIVIVSICINIFSCATIISGPKQDIVVNSNPMAAIVYVNGEPIGRTPLTAKLKRSELNNIELKLDGYESFKIKLSRGCNPLILGNILIGGVLGIVIDLATGSVYTIKPGKINTNLVKLQEKNYSYNKIGTVITIPKKLQNTMIKVE